MWRERDALEGLETEVLLVSFQPADRVREILEEWDCGWPVLVDEERAVYRAYGFRRGSLARVWLSPRTVWYYLRSALRGRRPRRPAGDSRQLGGDIIIDREGRVVFAHRSSEPADRPPVEEILRLLAALP